MHISLRGWSRDCGRKYLADEVALDEAKVARAGSDYTYRYKGATVVKHRDDEGTLIAIDIAQNCPHVTASGQYLFEMRLTRTDILWLFLETFGLKGLAKQALGVPLPPKKVATVSQKTLEMAG